MLETSITSRQRLLRICLITPKVQNGKTILARKPQRTKKSIAATTSPAALTRQQRFADLCRMATENLSTTTLRATYEKRFNKQKQYATLRGFIIHSLSQSPIP